ncbi:MAG: response regulator [Elusimicrobia bacterium]|nr:response regulator [Elusimicrobiota bacterium]
MPYYLYEGDKAIGPFEAAQLALRPGFKKDTLVFPAGATTQDAWKPAEAFPDLARALDPNSSGIFLTAAPPRQEKQAPPPEAAPLPAAPSETAVAAPAPALAAPGEKLILVVDDDETVRSFLEMSASIQGFRVLTAVDGLDAGAKLETQTPDLIITDLMMPGQGGYEFLRSLQGKASGRIPIFVVTGSVLDDSTIKMIRAEANVVEFVAKPVKMAKFVAALHKTLKTEPR